MGGIIETDNVLKLVQNNFINNTDFSINKTLIITPNNMINLWKTDTKINYEILSYDQLFLNDVEYHIANYKNFTHIIIHECYESFLPKIKLFVDSVQCTHIWIINSLPLKYYFSNKLIVNKLSSLTNIWLGFTLNNKKIYKNEIIKFLLTGFNKYYFRVSYSTINICHELNLSLSDFEINVMTEFKNKYNYWRDNLTDDQFNIYSHSSKKLNHKLEVKIFNAILSILCSVTPEKDLALFFMPKLNSTLSAVTKTNNMLKDFCNKYTLINKSLKQKIDAPYINTNNEITETQIKINKSESIINNYNRYLQQNFYQVLPDKNCCVCYDEENTIKTRLICGHCICLSCILNTISRYNKCPICNEYITIDKIAIIKETVTNYHSELVNFLEKYNTNVIILTNLNILPDLSQNQHKITIININDMNISDKIKKINSLNNIIILTSEFELLTKTEYNDLKKIINHLMLFDQKPNVIKINIENYFM